jgi:hypothetical protein
MQMGCHTSLMGLGYIEHMDQNIKAQQRNLMIRLRAQLERDDPDVIAAIDDVDRPLVWSCLQQTPLERLAESASQARFYDRMIATRSQRST